VDAGEGGRSHVVPGLNLYTVGTVRDGAKWPARDRRRASRKRDLIVFDVFSPYTLERLLAGEKLLTRLAAETDKAIREVPIKGAFVKRLLLRSGAKFYRTGIGMTLYGALFERAEEAAGSGLGGVREVLTVEPGAVASAAWADVSGLLVARERLDAIASAVESGEVASMDALLARLEEAHASYGRDAWASYAAAYRDRCGKTPADLDAAGLAEAADAYLAARGKFIRMVLADAEKEYGTQSRIGFGMDGDEGARETDFAAVRGTFEKDKFVSSMRAELEDLTRRVAAFKKKLGA
jgi:hypothetical protein